MLIRTVLVAVGILLSSFICCNYSVLGELPCSDIVYVGGSGPGNYSGIQAAIDDVDVGGTVFVYSGTYYENVLIDKKISVIGEDKNSTVVDAGGKYFGVSIDSDSVVFENFFVRNATSLCWPDPWVFGALSVINASNVSVLNNIFSNDFIGVCLLRSHGCVLKGNKFYGCSIAMWGGAGESKLGSYIHDIDQSNQINNKTVYYYLNERGIHHTGDAGEIFFVNCSDCCVSDVLMDNASACIQVLYSTAITVENSRFMDITSTAIHLDHADNNIIQHNAFLRNNRLDYIFLDFSSYNCIQFNVINGYLPAITLMRNSNHNLIYRNSLSSKVDSILMDHSYWNVVAQNNIDGSIVQRFFNRSVGGDVVLGGTFFFTNKFYGNYWVDWIGNEHKVFRRKFIFGSGLLRSPVIDNGKIQLPFIWVDMNPAREPYLI